MFERLAMSCPMSDQLRYLDLPGGFVAVATQFVGNFKYLNWSQLKQATAVHKESCGRGFYSDKHSCSNGTRVAKPVGNGNTPSLSSCGSSGAEEERSGGNGLGVSPFVGSLTVPHGGIPFQSILLRCRFQNTFRRKVVFLLRCLLRVEPPTSSSRVEPSGNNPSTAVCFVFWGSIRNP